MRKSNGVSWQIITIIFIILLMSTDAFTHKQVVVVPLNSSSGQVRNNPSPCDSTTAGTIRWTGEYLEGCDGDYWGRFSITANVPTVTSNTGKIWMDRNLGASRVAESATDSLAYGDLYQWGRLADGHQSITSPTALLLSDSDIPGHNSFILSSVAPHDWRDPQNTGLWQGEFGINNPCPSGFRLPTEPELNAERLIWISGDSAGAFASPLKLVVAGHRSRNDGVVPNSGTHGYYWSSTVDGINSRQLYFTSTFVNIISNSRAYGFSVRCIQD